MDNRSHVVVTTFGTDRPGIVEVISKWLLDQGGNIEESRMSLLGGEFATLILVSGEEGLAAGLERTKEQFENLNKLTVFMKSVSAAPEAPVSPSIRYGLKATSLDHPGIVHQVSALLSRNGINIVSAETRTTAAPFSAAPIFQFEMEIDVPGNVGINRLRDELRKLGDEQNIDVTLAVLTGMTV